MDYLNTLKGTKGEAFNKLAEDAQDSLKEFEAEIRADERAKAGVTSTPDDNETLRRICYALDECLEEGYITESKQQGQVFDAINWYLKKGIPDHASGYEIKLDE